MKREPKPLKPLAVGAEALRKPAAHRLTLPRLMPGFPEQALDVPNGEY